MSTSPGHRDGSILFPRALSCIVPCRRRTSTARPSRGSSSVPMVDGIGEKSLRTLAVKSALKLGGINFAARQGHGLEDTFVAEGGFLIRLFCRATTLPSIVIVDYVAFLSHRTAQTNGESKIRHCDFAETPSHTTPDEIGTVYILGTLSLRRAKMSTPSSRIGQIPPQRG